jgi:hypothetical protein
VGLVGDAGGGVPAGEDFGEAVGAPAVYWGDAALEGRQAAREFADDVASPGDRYALAGADDDGWAAAVQADNRAP